MKEKDKYKIKNPSGELFDVQITEIKIDEIVTKVDDAAHPLHGFKLNFEKKYFTENAIKIN